MTGKDTRGVDLFDFSEIKYRSDDEQAFVPKDSNPETSKKSINRWGSACITEGPHSTNPVISSKIVSRNNSVDDEEENSEDYQKWANRIQRRDTLAKKLVGLTLVCLSV